MRNGSTALIQGLPGARISPAQHGRRQQLAKAGGGAGGLMPVQSLQRQLGRGIAQHSQNPMCTWGLCTPTVTSRRRPAIFMPDLWTDSVALLLGPRAERTCRAPRR